MKSRRSIAKTLLHASALAAVMATSGVYAQYKVVGPDGKVTYTDRPPVSSDSRVSTLNSSGGSSEVALPIELRQAASRYPVTLYVTAEDCEPCTAARQLLRQRGVPYTEKQVLTPEDSIALERLSGGREAPTIGIGAQILRGLAPEVWSSYLDAAGYPRDSRLPANYQYPAPTPLIARAGPRNAAQPEAQGDVPVTLPSLPNSSGIRF